MTTDGVRQLYMWLSTAWPLVVKPSADEQWKRAKMNEIYGTFKEFDNLEVMKAYQTWTYDNDKYPTTKNIINEIKKERAEALGKRENEELHQAPIWKYGKELLLSHDGCIQWKRSEFVEMPFNPERLQPEEWERRFLITRKLYFEKRRADNVQSV